MIGEVLLAARRARYERVSELLASRSDLELAALTAPGRAGATEVRGGSVIFEVDGVPVFGKRVALTDLELAHPRSTANLFELPMFCHYFFGTPRICEYGFGGPALSAWRELAANLIGTDAVLAGESESFPVVYHWRVLPVRPPITAEQSDVDALVGALEGSAAVRARLDALRKASHSLVLITEFVPDRVTDWLREDPAGRADAFERRLFEGVASLRDHELLHLDLGLDNLRTDGDRIHFVDFGLATSPRFDLSAAERAFVDRLATYDADYAAMRLVLWLAAALCGVTKQASTGDVDLRGAFLRRCAEGRFPEGLPPAITGILSRHAPTAARTYDFFRRLFGGELHTAYPGPLPVSRAGTA